MRRPMLQVDDYLALRTLLVGYAVSLADLACWGQLQGERLGSAVGAGRVAW